jgi:ATP-dependent DNA helicase RecQ
LRLTLAQERKVPAFVILHDATLNEIARTRPKTLDQMASISGIGPRKLEQFGQAFMEIVTAH